MGDTRHIYQNELDIACFQLDITGGSFKDLTKRTASKSVLHNKAFDFARHPKYNGYQRGLASVVYKFLIKSLQILLFRQEHELVLKTNNQ